MTEEQESWRELFEKIAAVVAEWRQQHPRATLTEIEQVVDQQVSTIRREMVEDLAQQGQTADLNGLPVEERPHCPRCGRPVVANGKQKRRLQTDYEQQLELERSKAYCQHCEVSFFPSG